MLLQIAPVARTAMDKKSGNAMNKYYKDVAKVIDGLAPWIRRNRRKLVMEKARKANVESGTVVVQLGPGESEALGIFKGAKVIK